MTVLAHAAQNLHENLYFCIFSCFFKIENGYMLPTGQRYAPAIATKYSLCEWSQSFIYKLSQSNHKIDLKLSQSYLKVISKFSHVEPNCYHGTRDILSEFLSETSEILVSREFSRIFFHFHFSFSISSRFNFTFTSRKRVKGFYFSLFTSRKKWKLSVFHSFFSRKKSEIRCGV